MRILDLGTAELHPVHRFDSNGFMIGKITAAAGPTRISQLRLAPGGVVGRHPAVQDQLLIPLQGDALVTGSDGAQSSIAPGRAAAWTDGEQHETRTTAGLWALVVEGPLDL
ncbi:hypothetical protein [Microlunatus soli]|uniref:Cupin domain-containing protein n=1 Tax=Microlunatus soli TaxID=630515 RepID=A0A1H1P4M1_9ACTN|nr:hypothetical protein [Microlunatus soli]SDS06137.1 hypothetical protein SAMN04489812_0761 [Microlunatus soli]